MYAESRYDNDHFEFLKFVGEKNETFEAAACTWYVHVKGNLD